MERSIVLVSGGLDSATLLYWAKAQGYEVHVLSIDYYHRAPQERLAILRLVNMAGVHLIETDASFLKTARDVMPELTENTFLNEVPDGFIPMRNLIFYGIAFYYANLYGCQYIIGGHLETDCQGFPDASDDFFHTLEQLVFDSQLADQPQRIEILRPFVQMSKAQVIRLGMELGVPYEATWSCYNNFDTPCGECWACWERAKAFAEVGIPYPLITQLMQQKDAEPEDDQNDPRFADDI